MRLETCELCCQPGGEICWEDELCRVVLIQGKEARAYPGTCRVIWNQHIAEMTDLDVGDRGHLMDLVFATEAALRQLCQPHKINLASLGNMVPHLHWHVVPRYSDDAHFPSPIWAVALRAAPPERCAPSPQALHLAIAAMLPGIGARGS